MNQEEGKHPAVNGQQKKKKEIIGKTDKQTGKGKRRGNGRRIVCDGSTLVLLSLVIHLSLLPIHPWSS
jgi:hypothetical protein